MKKIAVIFGVLLCVFFLSNCMSGDVSQDIRGITYAGSQACKKCHGQVYDSFVETAHFHSTGNDLPNAVQAAFADGRNVFKFDDSISVVMEKKDGKYYQSYVRGGKKMFSHSFDIMVGSGRKAQTYLYYTDARKISQLPVSYFMSQHAWANSPGFPPNDALFDRNVPSYCLGCHSSYISVKQTYQGVAMQEAFEKDKIVYGIDCERCHGPAAAHVEYFTNHPDEKGNKFIARIAGLNRVQQNDQCALCHSGFRQVQQSLFNFKPGDELYDFYAPEYSRIDTTKMDVHGNQTQLMMASKCFQQSNSLTCNSCHNVHVKERENLAIFSQRCMNCHQQVKHSFAGNNITNNCIDCHMPMKPSGVITMLTNQQQRAVPDSIRTHLIAVYK